MSQSPQTLSTSLSPALSGPAAATRSNVLALGPVIALVLLLAIGTVLSPSFMTWDNLENVLSRSAFIGIIAIGATFVITSGGIDLSVGSMAGFCAAAMIVGTNAAIPHLGADVAAIAAGVLLGMVLAALAGLVNGVAVTAGRIEPFIVTLGMMGILRSLVTWYSDGGALILNPDVREVFRPVYFGSVAGIGWPVIVFFIVAAAGELIMRRFIFGRHVAAIGSNEEVARYSAIRVARIKRLTYLLQALCVALAVFLYVPRLGSATPTTGLLWELEAIAAVIIGGTLLKGGRGRVWGTVVGVVILSLIDNLLNLTNIVSPYLNGAIQGVVVIVAVFLQRTRAQ